MGSIHFESIATAIPPQKITSSDIINRASDFVSDEVIEMMGNMQIDTRYSVVDNFVDYLTGNIERKLITDVNALAVESIESCLERAKNSSDVGLLITITNTAARHLPCMSYELIAMTSPELIPRDINSINMQNQGCSVLVKAFEVASWYLKANPNKQVLITVAEAHTAMLASPLSERKIHSFHEIRAIKDNDLKQEEMLHLTNLINNFLFGDGAVSILLSHDEHAEDLKCSHLTNIDPSDTELLHMDEGGSLRLCP